MKPDTAVGTHLCVFIHTSTTSCTVMDSLVEELFTAMNAKCIYARDVSIAVGAYDFIGQAVCLFGWISCIQFLRFS